MKSLIKFEDTYGMTDIFCKCRGIKYFNPNDRGDIHKISNDTFITFGLGIIDCLKLRHEDINTIASEGITDLVIVIDTDNISGDKTKTLQVTDFRLLAGKLSNKLKSAGFNTINIRFMIIAYSAETILLNQYIASSDIHTEEYIHKYNINSNRNTNLLQLVLLAALSKQFDTQEAKKVRKYLDIDKLKEIVYSIKNSLNANVFDWILDNCNLKYCYSIKEAEDRVLDISNAFNKFINNGRNNVSITFYDRDNNIKTLDINLQDRVFDTATALGVRIH